MPKRSSKSRRCGSTRVSQQRRDPPVQVSVFRAKRRGKFRNGGWLVSRWVGRRVGLGRLVGRWRDSQTEGDSPLNPYSGASGSAKGRTNFILRHYVLRLPRAIGAHSVGFRARCPLHTTSLRGWTKKSHRRDWSSRALEHSSAKVPSISKSMAARTSRAALIQASPRDGRLRRVSHSRLHAEAAIVLALGRCVASAPIFGRSPS
jgi:hypothetical protein